MSNLTIKKKLTILLMTTSTMAVLLVCLMFYFMVTQHFQAAYQRDLENLVDIVGHNCTAALLFNVPEDADTVLSSLHSRQSVMAVRLYDKNHNLFAAYDHTPSLADTASGGQRVSLDSDKLLKIQHQVTLKDGTTVGRIVLYDNIHDIAISKKKGAFILTVTGIIALLAAFLLASFLQDVISNPLLTLTRAVQRLASGDFGARHDVSVTSQDEVGILSDAFIDMSQQLEDSYSQLEAHSQNLEKRVTTRTEELQRALSELTKSQEQLIQSEKMVALGHLVAGVAHEINNNINFISGAIPSLARLTQRLADQLPRDDANGNDQTHSDPAKTNQTVRKIEILLNNAEIGVQRTAKIVSDLNTFARPSYGRFTLTDIHQEIEMVLTLLRYELKDRIEIRREYAPDLPTVPCLQDQMNQVYMNILRNAIQAITGTGTIWIKTWLAGDMVNISFRDSGGGIPDSVRKKIFDPFFTTKQVGKGTGLGLSISYGIMRNHHGEITVDTADTQGAIFTIRLPIRQEDSKPGMAATPQDSPGGPCLNLSNND